MSFDLKKINNDLAYFRFKELDGKYLLTSNFGEFIFLSLEEFKDFVEGGIDREGEIYKELKEKGFVRSELDIDFEIKKTQVKKSYLNSGPDLHILVITLRCDQKCVYCQASAQDMCAKNLDMTKDIAKKSLRFIFKSTNKNITIEFQGGEPLVNWEVLKYVVVEAKKMTKENDKDLRLRVVSNLNLLNEDRYKFLIENNVGISTSLDGPESLQRINRPHYKGESGYKNIAKWVARHNKDHGDCENDDYTWQMGLVSVITKTSLGMPKEIIDEYCKLGFSGVFLRYLVPYGFSGDRWSAIGYTAEEFLKFYREALDYIIEINSKGKFFVESYTLVFLKKILTEFDPNMLELRSPCGAGIGQLAYNYDGNIYTCDEGRMMSEMGDDSFKLGNVDSKYEEVVGCKTVKSMCTASCTEALPGCADCVYMPYCGVCPVYNYFTQGNIFAQMPNSEMCKINKGILDYLIIKMQDKKTRKIFENWVK